MTMIAKDIKVNNCSINNCSKQTATSYVLRTLVKRKMCVTFYPRETIFFISLFLDELCSGLIVQKFIQCLFIAVWYKENSHGSEKATPGNDSNKGKVANFGIKENNCKYNSCTICDFGQYL